jgi:exopolyphosphatase/guanosine-5'-triphosphate,3'-diphosphate pyrophosphatase
MLGVKYITLLKLKSLYTKLKPFTVLERIRTFGLRPDRADVIVPALEIYIELLEKLGKKRIYVPKIGLADGIIRKLYEEKNI